MRDGGTQININALDGIQVTLGLNDAGMEAAGDAPYMKAMQKKYVVVQLSDNEGEILEVDPALISAFSSFRPAGGWKLHDNYWLAWGEARLKGLQIRPAR